MADFDVVATVPKYLPVFVCTLNIVFVCICRPAPWQKFKQHFPFKCSWDMFIFPLQQREHSGLSANNLSGEKPLSLWGKWYKFCLTVL